MTQFNFVLTTLEGLSGLNFWTAYHTDLTPYEQLIAQGDLQLGFFFGCDWSPGPDTWTPPASVVYTAPPPVVVVPPPWSAPPPTHVVCAPETATWLMLMLGLGALMLMRGGRKLARVATL